MRLTDHDAWTDDEWALAVDVRRVRSLGGPLSVRERSLADVCGSAERALRLLAAVARAERQLDVLLEVPASAPQFNIRPVPRPHPAASSRRPTRAGIARQLQPARVEIAAALVCAAGFAASAAHALAGAR